MNIVTRGFGYEEVWVTNFIEQAIGTLEEEETLVAALEEKADFTGILQELPDEYVGQLDEEDVIKGVLEGDDDFEGEVPD